MRRFCACKSTLNLTVIAKRKNKITWTLIIDYSVNKGKNSNYCNWKSKGHNVNTKLNKFGTTKFFKYKMTNTVAYPDLALEKLIGFDSSEDPTAFNRLLEKRISFSFSSKPAVNENNIQTVYDDRRKALFGSLSRGPAAEWFNSLEAASTWAEMKTQFIAGFTDGKKQCRFQFEAENLKTQPDENIKSYIHRKKTLVDRG